MAKTSAIARQTKRERLVALYAPKRKALKEVETTPRWINFHATRHRFVCITDAS